MRFASRKQRLVLAIFLLQAALGIADVFHPVIREKLFPIFSWDLFSRVPKTVTEYVIYVESIDEKTLPQAVDIRRFFRIQRFQDPANYLRFPDEFYEAYKTGSAAGIQQVNSKLKRNFFVSNKSYHVSLRKIEYDPLEYWHSGKILKSQTISELRSKGSSE